MRVKIKADKVRLWIPVPLSLISVLIKFIPESKLDNNTKMIIVKLSKSLKHELKKYKGLEIVEIRSEDGTYVSVVI